MAKWEWEIDRIGAQSLECRIQGLRAWDGILELSFRTLGIKL